jgi:hypothetical protein
VKRLSLALLAGLSGCALIEQLVPKEKEPPPGLTREATRIGRGREVMAGAVAMQDLLAAERTELANLSSLAEDGGVQDGGTVPDANLDFHRCFLDPATYGVWVERDDAGTRWHVVILPEAPCSEGVYGGGGQWKPDGESLEILEREIFE